jgi:hypothetical protein
MKIQWTKDSAVAYLMGMGAEMPSSKFIHMPNGANGLKACSAIDFLSKYHNIQFHLAC